MPRFRAPWWRKRPAPPHDPRPLDDAPGEVFWRVYRVPAEREHDLTCVPSLAGEFVDGFPTAETVCSFLARANAQAEAEGSAYRYALAEPVPVTAVEGERCLPRV